MDTNMLPDMDDYIMCEYACAFCMGGSVCKICICVCMFTDVLPDMNAEFMCECA